MRLTDCLQAFVVVKEGHRVSADDVAAFVAKQAASFKHIRPENVVFTDAVPKSASGKILRRVLRAKVEEEAQQQR